MYVSVVVVVVVVVDVVVSNAFCRNRSGSNEIIFFLFVISTPSTLFSLFATHFNILPFSLHFHSR